MTIIRPERPKDIHAIYEINSQAFKRQDEARLVDQLRGAVDPFISLVIELNDGSLAGHILFTPVLVRGDADEFTALALGPMAVHPDYQNQGLGSQLIRAGLNACRATGYDLVFVLGHADFYPRFGFTPTAPFGIHCTYPVPDEVFMVAELQPGALGGRTGTVLYHPAFDQV